jgi:shikimate kinase
MNQQTRLGIAESGVSVWLKADLDLLMQRVAKKPSRPLLQNPDPRAVMARLMEQRYPVYAAADITIVTRDERREIIAAEVVEALKAKLATPESVPERNPI